MMPIFGDPLRFAVEYIFDDQIGGVWMYGDIYFWCGGKRVGSCDNGTTLRDVLFQLDEIAKYRFNRGSARFQKMSAAESFDLLNWALFGSSPETREETSGVQKNTPEEEQWLRHLIFPQVDVFDIWKGFLVESGHTARLIFAKMPYDDIREVSLGEGEMDLVFDQIRSELNQVYERERAVVSP